MNNTIIPLANGDFTTKEYLDKNSSVDLQIESVKNIIVHSFSMGDVEDPDLMAAEPLIKWESSDQGQWIMANAIETPIWHRVVDHNAMGWRYTITAKLNAKDYTFWVLKWGS